ncbi:MAG: FkbM family methyltransferase [Deltaproteobacteria bacterium]|nr:FkbM family methyltransferase [Deltaproteobacteria bacterium]
MLTNVAKAVRTLTRRLGVDLVRYEPTRSVNQRRLRLIQSQGVDLVVDVGANIGQYVSALRTDGYRGQVVSFEPLGDAFAALSTRARNDGAWRAVRSAVGREAGTVSLNVAGNSFSSSMLPMLSKHLANAPDSKYTRVEQVPMDTLDELTVDLRKQFERLYLKIDVQGLEGQVLDGAAETLSRVRALECELSLVPLYEGQSMFTEIVDRLQRSGFGLVSIEPGFADQKTGQLLQVDGIFVAIGV